MLRIEASARQHGLAVQHIDEQAPRPSALVGHLSYALPSQALIEQSEGGHRIVGGNGLQEFFGERGVLAPQQVSQGRGYSRQGARGDAGIGEGVQHVGLALRGRRQLLVYV